MAKAKTPTAPRQKSQGTAKLTFGLVELTVDVVSMNRPGLSSEAGFRQVCPVCITQTDEDDEPILTRIKQVSICPENDKHGPFDKNDLAKAREIGADLYPVTPEQVAYVDEGTIPTGVFELHRVPTVDLLTHTYPSGYTYRLRPNKDASKTLRMIFGGIVEASAGGKTTLIGQLKLKGIVRMYRFSVWQGQLLINELIRPDALTTMLDDLSDCEPTEQILQQLDIVLAEEAFDPEAWHDEKAARFADLDEKLLDGEVFVPPAEETHVADVDPEEAALLLLGGGLADKPVAPKAKARKPKAKAVNAA